MLDYKKVLVTGTAGFIGFHLTEALLSDGFQVTGLDSINDYYDVNLKYGRLLVHGIKKEKIKDEVLVNSTVHENYRFIKADLENHDFIVDFMVKEKFDYVVNLAAQAGVRYSLENPRAYTKSNIDGYLSILEGCRHSKVKHLVYASTSSIYGLVEKMPLHEETPTEHPMTLYAATKKANEMFAHSYSHLYGIPTTGLRFFTVYGPWGRPDMALFLFADAMMKGEAINVFNHGKMVRDFTFVKDIAESIKRLIPNPASPSSKWDGMNPSTPISSAPYQVFNIGNSAPTELMVYIEALENSLGIEAKKNMLPMQAGDVPKTHAEVSSLANYINFQPATKIEDGIQSFVNWYKEFYKL